MLNLTSETMSELCDVYGNAFYLLDSKKFSNNFVELSNEFKKIYPNFNIAYSYKTNYTPKLCKIVNENGGYAEVVSEMELEIALRIGVEATKIIWNGPIKNQDKIKQLLLMGGTVNIDSVFEIETIKKIAHQNPNHRLNLGIRCNFDVGDGVISRFGFDIDSIEFEQALDFIKNIENVHLINLQCHFAKRNVEYWPARAKGMATLALRVKERLGYIPDRIDIGGGLFGHMDDTLKAQFSTTIPTYEDYAKAAASVFAEHFPNLETELLIEPGSALVGDCMKFVGKIETIKTVRNKTFATMLGSQKNISMGGVNPPIFVIKSGTERKHYENVDIVGYTCIEGDVLYHDYEGDLSVGDYVVFSNCGSYSLVMKPPFILPNFPVIDISGNKVELIKRQEYFDDIFHTFSF
ncbi:MAG: pyridoxal-dependent decarboxylase [Paludibacteraceae bacterium]|nr:pyridoxal-dependent decarboxylase [Paludibacteraceae bacterium]